MSEQTIQITVSPQGAVSIKTAGFSGSSCRDATRELERALGMVSSEKLLPEFHSQAGTSEQIKQRN